MIANVLMLDVAPNILKKTAAVTEIMIAVKLRLLIANVLVKDAALKMLMRIAAVLLEMVIAAK